MQLLARRIQARIVLSIEAIMFGLVLRFALKGLGGGDNLMAVRARPPGLDASDESCRVSLREGGADDEDKNVADLPGRQVVRGAGRATANDGKRVSNQVIG